MDRMCDFKFMEDYCPDWKSLQDEAIKKCRSHIVNAITVYLYLAYCEECDREMYWPILEVSTRKGDERYADNPSIIKLKGVCERIKEDYSVLNRKYITDEKGYYKKPYICPFCGKTIPNSETKHFSHDLDNPYMYYTWCTLYFDNIKQEYIKNYTKEDCEKIVEEHFSEMRVNREKDYGITDNNKAEQYAKEKINDFQTRHENSDEYRVWSIIDKELIKKSPDKLNTFLNNVLKMETITIGTKKRLQHLYKQKKISELRYEREIELQKKRKTKIENDILRLEDEIKRYSPSMDSFGIYNPKEPEKVNEPDLEKPGLFNKKKVEAVNKQKMVEYQRKVQDYNASYQEYENTISANKRLYEDRKEAGKQRLVDKLESMRNDIIILSQDNMKDSPIVLMIDKEIETAEKLLQETYVQRNNYYNLDIVYIKYRNPVALASFCEYFASGRCTELEGVGGAYNIYENEIRLDRITDQLDIVIDSLDQIKKNQFTIYNELVQMNSTLQSLDESLNEAVDSIKEIEENERITNKRIEQIEKNTAVTAYYSKMNAYYSKKTAENTKAVAWLVALK